MATTKTTLPAGWRWAKLGDVTRVVAGTTPKSGVSEYWEGGDIVWITPTDLGGNSEKEITLSARRITKAGYESCGLEIVPTGSVVLSSRAPIGYLGIARVPLCTNQGCKSFVPSEKVTSEYLYFALKQAVPTLQKLGSGATFAEVSKTQLENFEIPLPPLTEQQRISVWLNEQMAAVAQARQAAEAQLRAARELPSADLREVFESQEAKKWSKHRLGDILKLRKEVIHPYDKPKGKTIFVGLEHIESHTGIRISSVDVEMSNLTGRKPKFYKGDIVYGYLRPYLNKVWVAEFDGLCSVDQYVYEINDEKANTDFVAWFMRSPVYLERAPIDTTPGQLPRIRTDEVASVEINLPPVNEQNKIAVEINERLENTKNLKQSLEAQLAEINQLPSALLRRAFAGEL